MNTVVYKGKEITYGFLAPGFWAKRGDMYEGGYRTERQAVNAIKRRIDKQLDHAYKLIQKYPSYLTK